MNPALKLVVVVPLALAALLTGCKSENKGEVLLEGTSDGWPRASGIAMDGSGRGLLTFQFGDLFHAENRVVRVLSADYSIEQGVGAVSETDSGSLGYDGKADLGIDASGRAVLLGGEASACEANSERFRLRSLDHDPLTGWQPPQVVAEEIGHCRSLAHPHFLERDLAIDAAGNALAVWVRQGDDRDGLFAAWRLVGGSWSAPVQVNAPVGPGQSVRHGRIAMNADGRALVAYRLGMRENSAASRQLFVASFDFASGFGAAVRLDDDANVWQIGLAIDGAGNGLAVWSDRGEFRGNVAVNSRRYVAGAGWTAGLRELPDAIADNPLQVGLDASGNGWLVYADSERQARAVPFRGDDWLATGSVSLAGNAQPRMALAVAPTGDATVVLTQGEESLEQVATSLTYRRFYAVEFDPAVPGSGWQPAVELEAPAFRIAPLPVVAMEHRDSGLAAWATQSPLEDGLRNVVQIRAYVWAPPLAAFEAKADRLVVEFDASASRARTTDRGIGSYEWDFENDGVFDDTGFRASHTYPTAGTYGVHLRVTDGEGISNEIIRSVAVDDAAPPPPPMFTLSVTTSGGTGFGRVFSNPPGIDCGFGSTDCSESYTAGTIVVLTHQAGTNSRFDTWEGDPDCLDGRVTMDADKGCFASFTGESGGGTTFELGFQNVRGPGHVETGDGRIFCPGGTCRADYAPGDNVQVVAFPDQGALLEAWEGDCSGFASQPTIDLLMNDDVTCSAVFSSLP